MVVLGARENTEALSRFSDRMPAVQYRIVAEAAEQYAEFVRREYLSGQKLRVRTGRTRRSIAYYPHTRDRKNVVYAVRPGHGLPGRMNYLYKFERNPRKAFMGPSSRKFLRSGKMQEIAAEVLRAAVGIL